MLRPVVLICRVAPLKRTCAHLLRVVPSLLRFYVLVVVFMFIFGVIGSELFHYTYVKPTSLIVVSLSVLFVYLLAVHCSHLSAVVVCLHTGMRVSTATTPSLPLRARCCRSTFSSASNYPNIMYVTHCNYLLTMALTYFFVAV